MSTKDLSILHISIPVVLSDARLVNVNVHTMRPPPGNEKAQGHEKGNGSAIQVLNLYQKNDKTGRARGLGRKTRDKIGKGNQTPALRFQTGGSGVHKCVSAQEKP